MPAWHAFRTEIKSEFRAERGLNGLGFETFVPIEKLAIIRCRRKHIIENPLFPRYGFVKFDVELDHWGQIYDTKGIEDILTNNQIPVRVPERDISQLKLAQKFGLFDRTKKPMPFKQGDEVEIGEGPFTGFIAKVQKARSGDRIKVLLEFFGSSREMEFSLLHLKAKS